MKKEILSCAGMEGSVPVFHCLTITHIILTAGTTKYIPILSERSTPSQFRRSGLIVNLWPFEKGLWKKISLLVSIAWAADCLKIIDLTVWVMKIHPAAVASGPGD
jgi:hypothetical protein